MKISTILLASAFMGILCLLGREAGAPLWLDGGHHESERVHRAKKRGPSRSERPDAEEAESPILSPLREEAASLRARAERIESALHGIDSRLKDLADWTAELKKGTSGCGAVTEGESDAYASCRSTAAKLMEELTQERERLLDLLEQACLDAEALNARIEHLAAGEAPPFPSSFRSEASGPVEDLKPRGGNACLPRAVFVLK